MARRFAVTDLTTVCFEARHTQVQAGSNGADQ
jgi:hypothetical protein